MSIVVKVTLAKGDDIREFEHITCMSLQGAAFYLRDLATKLEDEYNGVK